MEEEYLDRSVCFAGWCTFVRWLCWKSIAKSSTFLSETCQQMFEGTEDKPLDVDIIMMRGISAIFAIVLMVCLAFGILTNLAAITRIKRLKKNIYRQFAIGIFRTRWSKYDFFPVCVTNVREFWATRLSSLLFRDIVGEVMSSLREDFSSCSFDDDDWLGCSLGFFRESQHGTTNVDQSKHHLINKWNQASRYWTEDCSSFQLKETRCNSKCFSNPRWSWPHISLWSCPSQYLIFTLLILITWRLSRFISVWSLSLSSVSATVLKSVLLIECDWRQLSWLGNSHAADKALVIDLVKNPFDGRSHSPPPDRSREIFSASSWSHWCCSAQTQNRATLSNRRSLDEIEACFSHFSSRDTRCCSFFNETTEWRDPHVSDDWHFRIVRRMKTNVTRSSSFRLDREFDSTP